MKINYSQPAEVIANEAISYYMEFIGKHDKSAGLIAPNPEKAYKHSKELAIDKFECLKEVCNPYKFEMVCNPKYLKICEVLEYLNKII